MAEFTFLEARRQGFPPGAAMKIALSVVALSILSCRAPVQHSRLVVPVLPKPVTVNRLDQPPALVQWPVLPWTDSLRAATDSARVIGQVVLDTSGRVEPESFLAHGGTPPNLASLASQVAMNAVFSPGRQNGNAQRVLFQVNIDLIGRTVTPAPYTAEALVPTSEMVEEGPEVVGGPPLAYPEEARIQRITGRVFVRGILEPDGRVDSSSVHVVGFANPLLAPAAVDYVVHARFKPARWFGKKVRCIINLPIDFKMDGH